ncbi:hypothetical protein H744_1c1574 [Photobacterium gaetbulicola Gung47]|uniref:Uncharacterized protein n=1 Tax=Photobacterium gaetbulicola Gung47 TaxID=658445 RepID=A0A0C5WK37_9GAMM|nr:hypothetical protein H744_1c1574 [Photobacterium gaetbulicola Gung47]
MVTPHQYHRFGTDTDIVANIEFVDFPARFTVTGLLIAVEVTHHRTLEPIIVSIAVIAMAAFDDNVFVFDGFMEHFHFRPVLVAHHCSVLFETGKTVTDEKQFESHSQMFAPAVMAANRNVSVGWPRFFRRQ